MISSFFLSAALSLSASTWTPIGPLDGEVDVVASARSAPETVYVASRTSGGVFASSDSGVTWRGANVGLSDLRIQCLAVSPADPNVGYARAVSRGFTTTQCGAFWKPLSRRLSSIPLRR